jgi:hypothetical protein
MRSWKRWTIVGAVVLEASFPIAWVLARNSDAYTEADRFIRGNLVVAENVGSITSVSLEPLGYSLRFSGAGGHTVLEMAVEASRASGTADVELAKNGTWHVVAARLTLPGRQPITIAP